MRLQERRLTRGMLREAVDTLEIVEEYPRDKYLPNFLMRGDLEGDNIRAMG
jgi:hypothetical protein